MSSTAFPGYIDKYLEAVAKARALSDEDDDSCSALWRTASVQRQRRFFFKFIEGVMSAIRRLESNQLNNPDCDNFAKNLKLHARNRVIKVDKKYALSA